MDILLIVATDDYFGVLFPWLQFEALLTICFALKHVYHVDRDDVFAVYAHETLWVKLGSNDSEGEIGIEGCTVVEHYVSDFVLGDEVSHVIHADDLLALECVDDKTLAPAHADGFPYGFPEVRLVDWLDEICNAIVVEGSQGILLVGRGEDDGHLGGGLHQGQ